MKKVLSIILSVALLLSLTSCGVEQSYTVKTDSKAISYEQTVYYNEAEYTQLASAGSEVDTSTLKEVYKDGKKYYAQSQKDTMKPEEFAENGVTLDSNKFSIIAGTNIINFDFIELKFTFDKDVVKTNGELQADKRTVIYNSNNMPAVAYVFFDDATYNAKSITSLQKTKYTKKSSVKFKTSNVILSAKLNGKTYIFTELNSVNFTKQGNQNLKLTLANGYTKTFNYVYDIKAPTTNVKNNKTYKKNKQIIFSDKYGVKKATLNGKKIKNKKKLKTAGKYTLKVWDKAGNMKKVTFKIIK